VKWRSPRGVRTIYLPLLLPQDTFFYSAGVILNRTITISRIWDMSLPVTEFHTHFIYLSHNSISDRMELR
jgi:hypothetical protein